MLLQALKQLALSCINLTYNVWSTSIILPLFIFCLYLSFLRNILNQTVNRIKILFSYEGLPIILLLKTLAYFKKIGERFINGSQETRHHSRLLRQSRSEQQVAQTFSRAAANPDEITQNEKVLMMMQKMKRLQQILYQQSIDRRKAEAQLFELRQKFQQKSSALIKQKSQCVQNINKINVLKLQLAEKTENLQKSNAYAGQLQKQVKEMKQKIERLIEVGNKDEHKQAQQGSLDETEQAEDVAQDAIQQKVQPQIQGESQSKPVTENENLKMYAQKKKKKKVLQN